MSIFQYNASVSTEAQDHLQLSNISNETSINHVNLMVRVLAFSMAGRRMYQS